MIIRQTKPNELFKVLEFYKACNYSGGASPTDIIVCAEKDKKIIAVVRLCNENNVLVLRGMQVDEKNQRQGVGKELLTVLDKIISTKVCFCLPYKHLELFYFSIGFEKVDEANAPVHLVKRLEKYRQKNRNFIIMKRHKKTSR